MQWRRQGGASGAFAPPIFYVAPGVAPVEPVAPVNQLRHEPNIAPPRPTHAPPVRHKSTKAGYATGLVCVFFWKRYF